MDQKMKKKTAQIHTKQKIKAKNRGRKSCAQCRCGYWLMSETEGEEKQEKRRRKTAETEEKEERRTKKKKKKTSLFGFYS